MGHNIIVMLSSYYLVMLLLAMTTFHSYCLGLTRSMTLSTTSALLKTAFVLKSTLSTTILQWMPSQLNIQTEYCSLILPKMNYKTDYIDLIIIINFYSDCIPDLFALHSPYCTAPHFHNTMSCNHYYEYYYYHYTISWLSNKYQTIRYKKHKFSRCRSWFWYCSPLFPWS